MSNKQHGSEVETEENRGRELKQKERGKRTAANYRNYFLPSPRASVACVFSLKTTLIASQTAPRETTGLRNEERVAWMGRAMVRWCVLWCDAHAKGHAF